MTDETSAIKSPLGVLLLGPGKHRSQVVRLDEQPAGEPVPLPGLNDVAATVVRPMDREAWEATRRQRAAEHADRLARVSTPPNPFRNPVGYRPPTTVDISPLQHGELHDRAIALSERLCDEEALEDPAGDLARHADRLAAISVTNTSGGDPRAPHALEWARLMVSTTMKSEE